MASKHTSEVDGPVQYRHVYEPRRAALIKRLECGKIIVTGMKYFSVMKFAATREHEYHGTVNMSEESLLALKLQCESVLSLKELDDEMTKATFGS